MRIYNHTPRLPSYVFIAGKRCFAVFGKKSFLESAKPSRIRIKAKF